MKLRLLFAAILILVCGASYAEKMLPMLNGLPTLKDYSAMRNSSTDPNWQDGNGDARPIPPGQTLTLAELQGPGKITHIWFTIADNERYYGKKLLLRMYWDDEESPSVDVPLNDFFCQGHGLDLKVNSLPIRVTADGKARNCYFVMPFRKSARIEVKNEGNEPVGALYWYIDWQKYKGISRDTAYFHAQYRQEFPCESGKDYVILDAEGKGHYVGCNLSVRCLEPGWWGEGDDRFYIDDESKPSIMGTGSEDFFCDAWGIREMDGLFYGCPLMEGLDLYDRMTSYRFNIPDPIPFDKSLKVTIEHKGARLQPDGNWNGYMERADDFSSVAYWYQIEPHKPFPKMPPVTKRLYKSYGITLEAEGLIQSAEYHGGDLAIQELQGWSGGKQLFFTPKDETGYIKLKINVPEDGRYMIRIIPTRSWDYGIYDILLDGAKISHKLDLYSDLTTLSKPVNLGIQKLSKGEHSIGFACTGRNPASDGYYFGLDAIELIPIQ